jgi:hypothetical protein
MSPNPFHSINLTKSLRIQIFQEGEKEEKQSPTIHKFTRFFLSKFLALLRRLMAGSALLL